MISNRKIIEGEKIKLPTKYGHFHLVPFQESVGGLEHMALIKGDVSAQKLVLVRIHSACATGDLFGSLKCDCGEQLIQSMKLINSIGTGIVVYLQQEGRGIGLMNKIKAYKLQEEGLDTVDANVQLGYAPDERNYEVGATILKILGVKHVQLITNNPDKIESLEKYGIEVAERISLPVNVNSYNYKYMNTKRVRMKHIYGFTEINNKELVEQQKLFEYSYQI